MEQKGGDFTMENGKRLIDANALFQEADKALFMGFHAEERKRNFLDMISAMLDNCSTVDAVEVVHGHWCWEGRFKACSQCGSYVEWDETLGANFWKFCPYCGARMDGEEDG